MAEQVPQHGQTAIVPDGFHALVSRRLELIRREITIKDFPEMARAWIALADDFQQIGYANNAQNCRDRARRFGWAPPA